MTGSRSVRGQITAPWKRKRGTSSTSARAISPRMVEDLLDFHDRMVAKHGLLPDSTEMIREMRRDG